GGAILPLRPVGGGACGLAPRPFARYQASIGRRRWRGRSAASGMSEAFVQISEVLIWLVVLFGAITGAGAKLAWLLFGVANVPPRDEDEYRAWAMKRRWLVVSELAALP